MKYVAEKTINKYLPPLKTRAKELKIKNLPAFLQSLYSFEQLYINENPYLVINVKDRELGPREFKKHARTLRAVLDYPQIWCLPDLHFHKVRRMIQQGMNFVIEEKQVHLPSVSVSIKAENQTVWVGAGQLNGLAVNMMIREILKGDLSGKNKLELANIFDVTQMTAGRAIRLLLASDLCHEKKEGVSKYIYFQVKADLWGFLKARMGSPVKEIVYLGKIPKGMPCSGITALSKRTMVADDRITTFAMTKKKFKKDFNDKEAVLEEFAKAKIELWDRSPILVEKGCVNPLDIYLINKNNEEERVQIALEKLLKAIGLEMG